ncbi:MAG: AtpZ/AtpI family protein [Thermoanaerobaculia bacterium]
MASDPEQPAPRKRGRYNALAEASSLGFMFPIAIGLGYFWGRWMDGMFGTAPWLTWIFSGFGLVAAFVNLFRFAARADGEDKKDG